MKDIFRSAAAASLILIADVSTARADALTLVPTQEMSWNETRNATNKLRSVEKPVAESLRAFLMFNNKAVDTKRLPQGLVIPWVNQNHKAGLFDSTLPGGFMKATGMTSQATGCPLVDVITIVHSRTLPPEAVTYRAEICLSP
ncbi:MAG: hypothetical protein K2X00_23420 [Nitrospiraceae bacterium]|nr:hypothetical protein [Nitrospiraceae bacterium]